MILECGEFGSANDIGSKEANEQMGSRSRFAVRRHVQRGFLTLPSSGLAVHKCWEVRYRRARAFRAEDRLSFPRSLLVLQLVDRSISTILNCCFVTLKTGYQVDGAASARMPPVQVLKYRGAANRLSLIVP